MSQNIIHGLEYGFCGVLSGFQCVRALVLGFLFCNPGSDRGPIRFVRRIFLDFPDPGLVFCKIFFCVGGGPCFCGYES